MKIRYDVGYADSVMGDGHAMGSTRFTDKKEAFEFAKLLTKQDRFGKAVMTQIVWNAAGSVTERSCYVKANGNWQMI